ncbi:MAG: sulfate reduction electron transfer complex DsrMKJOP subunit DsrJ [Deltaproteobacteria bacterium]|nr:sulfate reduction electron transfer complex DsrMKJOP subunit DsrJ [Deltaproteobacteria bacterium]MBW2050962.1 sulfate reduction electron transfer complex DsrMKJOP subunit DsrJ [Deltaproteobacteria bacterium]MBW2139633.1 sulfate reduction electron transfer complex DsrMKJOP subunit DsrJ [Deltaproteobacteria bacterium]MBW2322255.1 sulfate reduction electron transfer complex DsrMKJOP subunit DsrJ [Deltaproteobacteria bacterium]
MYDSGKIIAGLVIFIILITFPFWYNHGKASIAPDRVLPKDQKECVEEISYMTSSHMQLLNDWRTSVVRDTNRIYKNKKGKTFSMSLTNTCLDCHSSKADFCDKCHNYLAVVPYCWECHLTEKGNP